MTDPARRIEEVDPDDEVNGRSTQFYDLMKHKVTKILLVSSPYEAFILEEDGILFEQISYEYEDMSLTSPPRINRVSSAAEALEEIGNLRYDLIITMARLPDMDPLEFGRKVKEAQPSLPVVLLLMDRGDLSQFHIAGNYDSVDKVFLWNGDSTLFLAINKLIEDMKNVSFDTTTGLVRVILIVEDSPRYYSIFLPLIFTEILRQSKLLISEGFNEQDKLLRKRSRPKIIMAETFEEAIEKYSRYKKSMLCVISDVSFPRDGKLLEEAGFELIDEIEEWTPVLLNSSHDDHMKRAQEMGVPFLNKNSTVLLSGIREFFKERLGYGDFIFRMSDGTEIDRAKGIHEFMEMIKRIPSESLFYHGRANQFSSWLLARGEVDLAAKLRPKKVSDFRDGEEMREHIIEAIKEIRRSKQMGVILDFDSQEFEFEGTVTKLGGGSLGGKGRGIAFLSSIVRRSSLSNRFRGVRIKIPETLIIGTEWFDRFSEVNREKWLGDPEMEDHEISKRFLEMEMPGELVDSLRKFISHARFPLAVRSSSLLEDSHNQPFAGIYSTYMLPNNCPEDEVRLAQLVDAVKLVYASAFHKAARSYMRSTVHVTEEEKMAVVIQRLVGNRLGDKFFPFMSGVSQSLNFYPAPPLTREDGITSAAYGLGRIVVEGGRVLSFSPNRPGVLPGFYTAEDMLKNSQKDHYALEMGPNCGALLEGDHATLVKQDIADAEDADWTGYVMSTYDPNDGRLRDGVRTEGPRLVTFAGILKVKMIPVDLILKELMDIGKKGIGRHIEIEFALALGSDGVPEFYPLQIRPLVTSREKHVVSIPEADFQQALVRSESALGNGAIDGIRDVIFIPYDLFDVNRTVEIASEIGAFNEKMCGSPYILIGPGRWGTRDRFLGIPVRWDQISCARAMVEYSTEDHWIDPSHGTHFFHNITSLNIPYLSAGRSGIDWDRIAGMEVLERSAHAVHAVSKEPLRVVVDGRSGKGAVMPEN